MMIRISVLLLAVASVAFPAGKSGILAVFAHPDDETTVSPLLARYTALGHPIRLVTVTSGQKGTGPFTRLSGDALGAAREDELRCAARLIGIPSPVLLQYQDQGISQPEVMAEIAGHLRRIIAEARPDVVITFGPDGATGHPDHRAVSNIVTAVFQERELLAYRPKKLYYVTMPESIFGDRPFLDPRLPFLTVADQFITTDIDTTAFQEGAASAIRCHKSQYDAPGMRKLESMNRVAENGHIFLRLAIGDVPAPAGRRESDIFRRHRG
jgi:LmbE family N-acetylglucosaminyl deacetylase